MGSEEKIVIAVSLQLGSRIEPRGYVKLGEPSNSYGITPKRKDATIFKDREEAQKELKTLQKCYISNKAYLRFSIKAL